jgi:hypothetical protein
MINLINDVFAGLSVANNCFNGGKCDSNAELQESVKYVSYDIFIFILLCWMNTLNTFISELINL